MYISLFLKYMAWRGKAVDISSVDIYPAGMLNKTSNNTFLFDNIWCACIESFLESLHYSDLNKQREICGKTFDELSKYTTPEEHTDNILWWNGESFTSNGQELHNLIRRAYKALFVQNIDFQTALLSTGNHLLFSSKEVKGSLLSGKDTGKILTDLREQSYHILQDNYMLQESFMRKLSASLVERISKEVSSTSGTALTEKGLRISEDCNPEIFPYYCTFFIDISAVSIKCGDEEKMLSLDVGAKMDNDTRTETIHIGTLSDMKKFISDRTLSHRIFKILLEDYDILSRM